MQIKRALGSLLVDTLCAGSIIGIWPRFIEPRLLKKTHLKWNLPPAYSHLHGLRVLHLSDLHFHRKVSRNFLNKILSAAKAFSPDLIFFTGDFLCYSRLEEEKRFTEFLSQFSAPLGCFCVFGNHDYSFYVSRNAEGNYDVMKPINPAVGMLRGLRTLIAKPIPSGVVTEEAKKTAFHPDLCQVLKKTSFSLLENHCQTLQIGLNIVGLGDYSAGRFHPEKAFQNYQKNLPGMVISHNPDTFPRLKNYPGDWIFSGHSHGEQIHFPYPPFLRSFSKKLTRLEYPQYSRGLHLEDAKMLYVTRGVGCHKPIRFCSPPELVLVTFQK